jgi:DNA-directed RNA polymerase specialized sigma24 family protein
VQPNFNKCLDEKTRETLDNAEWDKILPKVLKYATFRVNKYKFLGIPSAEPEDFVHEAIMMAYGAGAKGSYRKWNRDRYPDLADFLISIISSITSHESEHYTKFRHKSFGSQEEGTLDPLEKEVSSVVSALSPEQLLIQGQRAKEIIEGINKAAEGDEEMQMVLLCIDEGLTKPVQIAGEAGYDVTRVYNILKRIRRKLRELHTSILS